MDLIKRYLNDTELDKKIAEHKKVKKINKIVKTGSILIILIATLIFSYKLLIFLRESSIFRANNIIVEGNNLLSYKEVIETAGISNLKNIFEISLKKIENSLLQHPRIKYCYIKRKLPDTLYIYIEEKKPVALLNIKYDYLNRIFEVDEEGFIIASDNRVSNYDLPIITGFKDENVIVGTKITNLFLIEILKSLYTLNSRILNFNNYIAEINLSNNLSENDVTIILNRFNIPLYLGSNYIFDKLEKIPSLLGLIVDKIFKIDYIDFTGKDIIIKWREWAWQVSVFGR